MGTCTPVGQKPLGERSVAFGCCGGCFAILCDKSGGGCAYMLDG